MPGSTQRRVTLDSAQLRALAHPLRARLLSALRAYGPATATGLARRLQTNTGATSYHLRRLGAVGLIEEDRARSTGRERCWRAAHDVTSWSERNFDADPDDRAAADWLLGHHVRLTSRWLHDWVETRRDWPPEWRDAADQSDLEFHLTPDGLRALNADLHAVVERHRAQGVADAPGAQRCVVILATFPMPAPAL
ncbi:MAG: helix-turn-helix domain-containing protein [Actinomycetota bacterium]|nr:helix-turn-helix domain-containing protein [Actinomycetota bacterium]